jgi:hypothetical protein
VDIPTSWWAARIDQGYRAQMDGTSTASESNNLANISIAA